MAKSKELGTQIERYTVRYDEKQASGYWLRNQYLTISLKLSEKDKRKVSHQKALACFLKAKPGTEVISVILE